MSALLIRNLPPDVHCRLKQLAQRNRRSLSEEASSLLVQALTAQAHNLYEMPVPFQGTFPLTDDWLERAMLEGRA
jgi:hypothetical protein